MNQLSQQVLCLNGPVMDTHFYRCSVQFNKMAILRNCRFDQCRFQEQNPALDLPAVSIDSETKFYDCGYNRHYLVASILACRARELYDEYVDEVLYVERMSIPLAIFYLPFCWDVFLSCAHSQKEWALEIIKQQFILSENPPWEPHQ